MVVFFEKQDIMFLLRGHLIVGQSRSVTSIKWSIINELLGRHFSDKLSSIKPQRLLYKVNRVQDVYTREDTRLSKINVIQTRPQEILPIQLKIFMPTYYLQAILLHTVSRRKPTYFWKLTYFFRPTYFLMPTYF